jgi:hypothetical protein
LFLVMEEIGTSWYRTLAKSAWEILSVRKNHQRVNNVCYVDVIGLQQKREKEKKIFNGVHVRFVWFATLLPCG